MLDAVMWLLLLVLLLMTLTFATLGILVGLFCALVTTATTLFAYARTDPWEHFESSCERSHRPRLLALKKHALVAGARALVQRHARLAAQIDGARDLKDSVPHSTKDHSMQRNQLIQESHTVSAQLRTNWQKSRHCVTSTR
ncbi:uncharacterized protein BO95DRAFT_468920 [Aspergillus brunneoviolaceus CBS 621.78]|uniref:Uncharacterized protein n=1 Tax=Aspergillus brunneoviolaceus CBS 621.78 TaxID=1450534 RepID=A0ACD1FTK5_9EURO|nr:hypothetical protein BO95DRAFT_468920 [Aspergillus brunneoviolaceus CBS 621.78]RAH40292.1 hypothetical protein BO95DRAFT_468920 [Aspergillus brunneoviolaceus CBS 621.78]